MSSTEDASSFSQGRCLFSARWDRTVRQPFLRIKDVKTKYVSLLVPHSLDAKESVADHGLAPDEDLVLCR